MLSSASNRKYSTGKNYHNKLVEEMEYFKNFQKSISKCAFEIQGKISEANRFVRCNIYYDIKLL